MAKEEEGRRIYGIVYTWNRQRVLNDYEQRGKEHSVVNELLHNIIINTTGLLTRSVLRKP